MEIREYKVYKFDELSDEAKEKAVMKLFDINVDYNWWDCTYDELENRFGDCIELQPQYPFVDSVRIKAFNLDRHLGAEIVMEIDQVKLFNHFFKDHRHKKVMIALLKNDYIYEDSYDHFTVSGNAPRIEKLLDDLDLKEIERELSEVIASRLQDECDYLMSEDAIIETIKCNDYDFTEDGTID